MRRHGGARRILSLELLGFKNLLSPASLYSRVNRWQRISKTKKINIWWWNLCERLLDSSFTYLVAQFHNMPILYHPATSQFLTFDGIWKPLTYSRNSLLLRVNGWEKKRERESESEGPNNSPLMAMGLNKEVKIRGHRLETASGRY